MQQYDRDTINQPLNFISQDSFFPFKLTVAIESSWSAFLFLSLFKRTMCTNVVHNLFRANYGVPKIIWNLHKNQACHGWSRATVNVQLLPGPETRHTVYRCICSNRDRLGFYAEIQIIFRDSVYSSKYCCLDMISKRISPFCCLVLFILN